MATKKTSDAAEPVVEPVEPVVEEAAEAVVEAVEAEVKVAADNLPVVAAAASTFVPLKNNWVDNAGQYYNAAAMNAVASAINALYDPNTPSPGISRENQVISGLQTLLGIPGLDINAILQQGAQAILPTAVSNLSNYVIKNVTDTVKTVMAAPGQLIEGLSSLVVQPGEAITLISNGVGWSRTGSSFGRQVTEIASATTLPAVIGTAVTAILKTGAVPTLPTAAAAAASSFVIKNATDTVKTITAAVGQSIEGAASMVLYPGEATTIASNGVDKWIKMSSSVAKQVVNVTAATTLPALAATDVTAVLKDGAVPALPSAALAAASSFLVKNATATPKTLTAAAGQLIEGAAQIVLNPGEATTLISDGATNWVKTASSFSKQVVNVSTATTLPAVAATDVTAILNAVAAAPTLPSAALATASSFVIKNATTVPTKITAAAGQLIDGATSVMLNPGEATTLISDGLTNWVKTASSFSKQVTEIATAAVLPAVASSDVTAILNPGAVPTLPSASVTAASTYVVKNNTTADISLVATSGNLIEGAANIVLKPAEAVRLVSNGVSKWLKL